MRFWDGTTLTPDDVVFSLQRAASQKAGSQIAAFYSAVKSITASGDRVVVRMKQPDPYFRYAPAVTYILQKKYWQANLKDIGTPKKLTMCTGPHRFTKFQGDGTSELVAFDDYWGGPAGGAGDHIEGDRERGDAAPRHAPRRDRRLIPDLARRDRPVEAPLEHAHPARRRSCGPPICRSIQRSSRGTTSTCDARSPTRSTRQASCAQCLRGYGEAGPDAASAGAVG